MPRPRKPKAETKSSGIYCILNTINNRVYIGSAINIRKRFYIHKCLLIKNKHHSKHLQFAWNKYGAKAFKFSTIEYVNDNFNLIKREQLWLNYFKSYNRDFGYNICLTAGSSLGMKPTLATIEKMKIKLIGRKHTAESKAKMSVSRKGKIGKKHSEETKAILSKWHKNKKLSDEHKKNISISSKNRKVSEETRKKLKFNNRDFNKWPHELGFKCKCEECLAIKNKRRKQAYEKARGIIHVSP